MDKRQAKCLLQTCRGTGGDARDPQTAEARAWLERDAELAGWFAEEQAEDGAIAAKLREVPVPESLRAAILAKHAAPSPEQETQPRRRRFVALALAATIVVLATIALVFFHSAPSPHGLAAFRAEMQAVVSGPIRLAFMNSDAGRLQQWLQDNRGISGYAIPAGLRGQPGIGCRSWTWNGRPVGLICFKIENGKVVHLFVVEREAVVGASGDAAPQFSTGDGWTSAAWSQGEQLFLLVGEGTPDDLAKLL